MVKQSSLFIKGQKSLRLGNEEYVYVMTIRLVELPFDNNKTLALEDYFYVPDFKRNLISVSFLIKHGLAIQCNSTILIRCKFSFICSCTLLNGLVVLNPKFYDINAIESINNDNKHIHLSKKKEVSNELTFGTLDHINHKKI